MSSSFTDELAERLVVGVDRLHPREVQQRVEQHRCVAGGQHEAVAVGPDRVLRVEAQVALPELVGDRRHRHRRARDGPSSPVWIASIDSVRIVLIASWSIEASGVVAVIDRAQYRNACRRFHWRAAFEHLQRRDRVPGIDGRRTALARGARASPRRRSARLPARSAPARSRSPATSRPQCDSGSTPQARGRPAAGRRAARPPGRRPPRPRTRRGRRAPAAAVPGAAATADIQRWL